jgi:hypothetical protein
MKIIIWCILLGIILFFIIPPYRATIAQNSPSTSPKMPFIAEYAQKRVLEVFGGYWGEFNDLIYRESKWNPEAQNPNSTAYGLGQFLNGTWDDVGCEKTSDPYEQVNCTIKYVKARYGNPQVALKFHTSHNWY